jgi:hypothetical protein
MAGAGAVISNLVSNGWQIAWYRRWRRERPVVDSSSVAKFYSI